MLSVLTALQTLPIMFTAINKISRAIFGASSSPEPVTETSPQDIDDRAPTALSEPELSAIPLPETVSSGDRTVKGRTFFMVEISFSNGPTTKNTSWRSRVTTGLYGPYSSLSEAKLFAFFQLEEVHAWQEGHRPAYYLFHLRHAPPTDAEQPLPSFGDDDHVYNAHVCKHCGCDLKYVDDNFAYENSSEYDIEPNTGVIRRRMPSVEDHVCPDRDAGGTTCEPVTDITKNYEKAPMYGRYVTRYSDPEDASGGGGYIIEES